MTKLLVLCFFLFMSCATVDVEKKLHNSGSARQEKNVPVNPVIFPEPEVVFVERPVFVPENEPPRAPSSGTQAVQESNNAGIVKPSQFSHAAMVYFYNSDWVYEVYAMPLRTCDIIMEPGENVVEIPYVSDSERWILGAGVSYENGTPVQHIYVKPDQAGIEASLIINTDRRVYHIILRSYRTIHMPIVRWRYLSGMPNNFIPSPRSGNAEVENSSSGIDPRFLSFNYRITYSLFNKPAWLPELVFDDGSKTYISFPEQVLQRELPAVFENRNDVINYRVIGKLIVIDKLIENITVKIGRKEITIVKRRGSNGR